MTCESSTLSTVYDLYIPCTVSVLATGKLYIEGDEELSFAAIANSASPSIIMEGALTFLAEVRGRFETGRRNIYRTCQVHLTEDTGD